MNTHLRSVFGVLIAASSLTACGRNPGAHARAYPGTEKYEAAMAAAQPKCVPLDFKAMRGTSVTSGKEKFTTGRKGVFKLDSYVLSQAFDRTDRTVPNAIYQITEFEDLASAAPRLAIESKCLDLKGIPQSIAVSPVTQIDSATGTILQTQPFTLGVSPEGKMNAESELPASSKQVLRAGKIPEAALLLGSVYAANFKTISFRVKESDDGSLVVNAEFIGVDENLSRIFIRVEAVYGWDAAE